jgi:hypothetical protein
MNTCPFCVPAMQLTNQTLLQHLLVDHPTARLSATLVLTVGTALLAKRPQQLLALYFFLIAGAWILSRQPSG